MSARAFTLAIRPSHRAYDDGQSSLVTFLIKNQEYSSIKSGALIQRLELDVEDGSYSK